jgi:hypothetical protein
MPFSNPVEPLAVQEAQALTIAEAIQAAGISLLGAPVLLYQTGSQQNYAGPLGVVVNTADYGLPTYTATAEVFDTYSSTNMGTQFSKVFLTEGQWTITAQMSQLSALGASLLVSAKPNRPGGPNDPGGSYGDTVTTAERHNLANWIQSMQQAGITFHVTLWQEPNDQGFFASPAAYEAYVAWYGPVVCNPGAFVTLGTATPVPLIYDPGSSSMTTAVSYWPGTGIAGVTWYAICTDFYTDAYFLPNWTVPVPDYLEPLYAVANAAGLPFGLGEWGYNHTDETGYPYFKTYCDYLVSLFGGRIVNAQPNYVLNYWNSSIKHPTCTVTGPDDPKVPGIQSVFNALNSSGSLLTVPAGGTVTVAPITGSQVAGYAIADSISIDISVGTLQATAAGQTNPFLVLTYSWYDIDASDAIPLATGTWVMPIGESSSGGTFASGSVPQHGGYLAIDITNQDAVPCTLVLSVVSNSRTVGRDDIRWDAPSSTDLAGYSLAGGVGYTNSLGTVSATIAHGASTSRVLSLFAGNVWVSFNQSGATAANEIEIELQPLPASLWRDGAPILNTFAANFPLAGPVTFPRCPVLATFSNNQASGSVSITATFIAAD